MTQLKMEQVSYFRVDCADLEQFIIEMLGVREDFSVAALLEAGNDTQHEIVPARLKRNDDQYNEVVAWRADPNGVAPPSLPVIMGWMVVNGLIEHETYMVDICW